MDIEKLRNTIVLELSELIQNADFSSFLVLTQIEKTLAKVSAFEDEVHSPSIRILTMTLKQKIFEQTDLVVNQDVILRDLERLKNMVENIVPQNN